VGGMLDRMINNNLNDTRDERWRCDREGAAKVKEAGRDKMANEARDSKDHKEILSFVSSYQ